MNNKFKSAYPESVLLTIPGIGDIWYIPTMHDSLIDYTYILWHRSDGIKLWFVNDKQYRDNKSFQEAAAGITDEEMVIMIIKYGDVK